MKQTTVLGLAALASTTQACILPEERAGVARRDLHGFGPRQNSGAPIGTGDRFNGGAKAPRGLGSQNATFDSILNVDEVVSGLKGLASEYGIETFTSPYKTYEGATIHGAKVGGTGGTCADTYRVYFNGNIHARERGSADNILFFISDLLYADKNNVGLTYGDASYTSAQVKKALSAGIVFTPLSNPDGVAHDQEDNDCWRLNRNATYSSTGVDLNRNFDLLWDNDNWAAGADVASDTPGAETFHGDSPFSEAETQSISWVFDQYAKIRWFIDLHSYGGDVLWSWGTDSNQDDYPYMSFLNETYSDTRGLTDDTPGRNGAYGEYRPADELDSSSAAGKAFAKGALQGGGRQYAGRQSAYLYATSGASDDWAYSRHFADESTNLVHAYTVEFGFGTSGSCPFYPTVETYNENMLATNAGFMEFLLSAVDEGLGDEQTC